MSEISLATLEDAIQAVHDELSSSWTAVAESKIGVICGI